MTAGLLLTAFLFGLRHGFDWDHIAAITELSTVAPTRRRGMWLSLVYALGHAAVILVLGVGLIAFGVRLPDGIDDWMPAVVGVSLIGLGAWVILGLVTKGREFRLRSRWMLIISGTFAGLRKVRGRARTVTVEHTHAHEHGADHDHDADLDPAHDHAHDHAHDRAQGHAPDRAVGPADGRLEGRDNKPHIVSEEANGSAGSPSPRAVPPAVTLPSTREQELHGDLQVHSHPHVHSLVLPGQPGARYESGTAAGIGLLHGVGVESPTQIAIFVASTSVAGSAAGFVLLLSWIVGLLGANTVLAVAASTPQLRPERSFRIYATLSVVVAVVGIALGTSFVMQALS